MTPTSAEVGVEACLAEALAHHEAGRLDQAEAGYRTVLHHDPHEPDALNLLAVILQDRGELPASIALLNQALDADPAFPEALVNLARAQRVVGDPAAAAAAARRAIVLDAELAEAHLQLGRALIDLRDNAAAADALAEAIAHAPASVDAWVFRGIALLEAGHLADAAESLTQALALDTDRAEAMVNLGTCLREQNRLDEALRWHAQAANRLPDDAAAHAALAFTLQRRHDLTGCVAACRRSLDLDPTQIDILLLQGKCLAALGQFAEAETRCRAVLAINPTSAAARRDLAAIGRETPESADLPRLRAVLNDIQTPNNERIAAGIAAGTVLDKAGDYNAAFDAYAEANRLIRLDYKETEGSLTDAGLHNYIAWVKAVFSPAMFTATAGWGDSSEMPVFIVGMPRSGTSLVEQIAASHPDVHGAGERQDIGLLIGKLSHYSRHDAPIEWDRDAVRQETAAHIQHLRLLGNGASRIIDKMPDNCQVLGQIAVMFPRCRIIICRRDLRDVCLSCYFQQFGEGMIWTTDQVELAARARHIDQLLTFWRGVLPVPVIEVQYETLVANLEGESRRLIDFLGLGWNPACLNFHETRREVRTASLWQVRQPLYSNSVGRWRHYQKHLGPLLQGLRGVVPDDD